jgi:hypothetical protein
MKKIVFLTITVLVLTFMIIGCENVEKDIEAIKELVLADEVWFDAGTPEDSTINDPSSLFFTAETLYWWRGHATPLEPDIDVQVDGDSAWVEWTRDHTAELNIFAWEPDTANPDTGAWYHWTKDISEHSAIRATLKNTGAANNYDGWELDKISCATGNSEGNTVTLDSIHIVSQDNDIWLTPPYLDYFYDIDSLTPFYSLEEVNMTAYTSGAEAVVFLHTIVGFWPIRDTFSTVSEGEHTGTWNAQWWPANRFIIFDVMAKSTLWNDDGVYDYSGVLFPYKTVIP